jgi:hypothetical protein
LSRELLYGIPSYKPVQYSDKLRKKLDTNGSWLALQVKDKRLIQRRLKWIVLDMSD